MMEWIRNYCLYSVPLYAWYSRTESRKGMKGLVHGATVY